MFENLSGTLTYFSFEKALGSFDSLGGNVDFRETSERAQTAVLGQLSCCCFPEDQQELMEEEHHTQVRWHILRDAAVLSQTTLMEPEMLTSLKLSLESRSSSTSFIMFFKPRWVCGAPSFSIICFSSIISM